MICRECDGTGRLEDSSCSGCRGDQDTGACVCEPLGTTCYECDGSGQVLATEAAIEEIALGQAESHPSDWNDVAMLAEMRALGYVTACLWQIAVKLRGDAAEEAAAEALDQREIGQHAFSALLGDIETATARAMRIDPVSAYLRAVPLHETTDAKEVAR